MQLFLPILLVAVLVFVECNHTFLGTNVQRPLLKKHTAKYSSQIFLKRIETYTYSTPPSRVPNSGLKIQGILAYDLTNTSATANVTAGGVGYPFVTLRMKSDRAEPIHYDIYIYG